MKPILFHPEARTELTAASEYAARAPEARSSASTNASSSACCSAGKTRPPSRASRHRAINCVSRSIWAAPKNSSGRNLWMTTTAPFCCGDN